jgi:HK97 family phage prohead protease
MEYLATGDFEFKADSTDGRIKGYGAYYGNIDRGMDVIRQGAFSDIKRSIKMLYQHNASKLLGTWDIVKEDSKGLLVEGNINMNTTLGRDVYELAKSGALSDMSVGFKTQDYEYDSQSTRHIKKAELFEVSLVTFPMNEKANILSVKSSDIENERDFEHFLKQAGYSNKHAKIITTHGFKTFMQKKDDVEVTDSDNILKALQDLKISVTI